MLEVEAHPANSASVLALQQVVLLHVTRERPPVVEGPLAGATFQGHARYAVPLDHVLDPGPVVGEAFAAAAALVAHPQAQVDPLLVVAPLPLAAEALIAVAALVLAGVVPPLVPDQAAPVHEAGAARVAEVVAVVHVHVLQQRLEAAVLRRAHGAVQRLRVELERYDLTFDVRVHANAVVVAQVLGERVQLVEATGA